MGNKIYKIQSDSVDNTKKEVYIDLNMESDKTSYTNIGDDESEYLAYLISEKDYEQAFDYIVSDASSEELKKKFTIIFNSTSKMKKVNALNDWFQKSRYKISKSVNVKAVFNSLRNIFEWIPGERIILPEFGSKLKYYLYDGITKDNIEKIIAEVRHSVSIWEPRVSIVNISDATTIEDKEDNTVRLDISFTIPTLSEEQYTYSYIYNRNNG